jgi:hypothetical protein
MHTSTFNGTSFVYNSDLSGSLIIVTKGHSIDTTYAAIREFVKFVEVKEQQHKIEAKNNPFITNAK